jgi:fido (protein-threonine AMPylation protein)
MSSLIALLKQLDNGPLNTILEKTVKLTSSSPTSSTPKKFIDSYLGFCKGFENEAKILAELVGIYDTYVKMNDILASNIRRVSISRWIFATNHIEGEGTQTEGETMDIINGYFSSQIDIQKNDAVLSTLALLHANYSKTLYKHDRPQEELAFDKVKLKNYHATLMSTKLRSAGNFRNSGAKSTEEFSEHLFPHHSLISSNIDNLGKIVYHLLKNVSINIIDNDEQKSTTLLYNMAIAAFAQFHVVDIHPFEDGNGRICRFISKRILDWSLPLPFPMFEDRNAYLGALCAGRSEYVLNAPRPLLRLLFKSAIGFYKSLLDLYSSAPTFKELFVGYVFHDIEKQMRENEFLDKDKEIILKLFEKMEPGDFKDFVTSRKYTIRLKKLVMVSSTFIDDI